MANACLRSPFIIFWYHTRIHRGNNLLKSDVIHVNDAGNYHLFMSYKNSLAHAIGHLNRMEGCTCETAPGKVRQAIDKR